MTPDVDLQELMTEGFSQLSRTPARVSLRSHETVPLRVVIIILLVRSHFSVCWETLKWVGLVTEGFRLGMFFWLRLGGPRG